MCVKFDRASSGGVWRCASVAQSGGRFARTWASILATPGAYIFEGGNFGPAPPMGARITPQAMRAPELPDGWVV